MKIAHIICTFPPYQGGMGNSAAAMARALVRQGHEVTILTPNFQAACSESVNWEGLNIKRLKPALAFGNAAVLPEVWRELKNFDIIHFHYPFYGTAFLIVLAKLLNFRNLKLVVHYHMDTRAVGWKGVIFWLAKTFTLPLIMRLADAVTCASLDYVKHSDVGAYYLKHRAKFSQVPFGVDIKLFQPSPGRADELDILFVGGLDRAHYFKGVDKLIAAFALLAPKQPAARLTIVGSGDLENWYRRLAEKTGLSDRIKFVNNVDNETLVGYYQRAAMLVLPSINQNEAFGLVLLEAMACGKPVVASNLPGVRSVFKNGKQGLTIKAGDIVDLAEKISRLLTRESERRRFGEAARHLVEKRYTWELTAARLNEIYCRLRFAPKNQVNNK